MSEVSDLLMQALNDEWKACQQYQIQAAQLRGLFQDPIGDHLRDHAEDEQGHAERLTRHLMARGIVVEITPPQFTVSGGLEEMLKASLKGEIEAIGRYKRIIGLCENTSELIETKVLVEDILTDEIDHQDELATMLKIGIKSTQMSASKKESFGAPIM